MYIIKKLKSLDAWGMFQGQFHYWGGGRELPPSSDGWREDEAEATTFLHFHEAEYVLRHLHVDNPGCHVCEAKGNVGGDPASDYDRAMRGI